MNKKRAGRIGLLGYYLFLLGIVGGAISALADYREAWEYSKQGIVGGCIAIMLGIAIMLHMRNACRCPACKTAIHVLHGSSYKFCPWCGKPFDKSTAAEKSPEVETGQVNK